MDTSSAPATATSKDSPPSELSETESAASTVATAAATTSAPSHSIPDKVTYLIVGAGTAAFAAYRSIRTHDPKAQVGLASCDLQTS